MGSNGLVTEAFSVLLKQLWASTSQYISPHLFKRTFQGYDSQFVGNDQHDSQEFFVETGLPVHALGEAGGRAPRGPEFDSEEAVHRESHLQGVRREAGGGDVEHLSAAQHESHCGSSLRHDVEPDSVYGVW